MIINLRIFVSFGTGGEGGKAGIICRGCSPLDAFRFSLRIYAPIPVIIGTKNIGGKNTVPIVKNTVRKISILWNSPYSLTRASLSPRKNTPQ
jgi:hypothetical protein